MITQVKVGQKYINTSVAITNNDGAAFDPTSAEVWFYKISQIDGSISLDTNINGTGKVPLSKQDGQTGFYGASIDIASFLETEYIVLYKVLAESTETITVEYLSIDLSKKQIGEIKIETDKIQPEIIDKKDEFKADVSNLATSLEISTLTTLIERILGLSQENYRITSTIYDGDLLTNATIKIYPTKADCEADTNAIAIYKMFATFDAYGKCIQYQVTKE